MQRGYTLPEVLIVVLLIGLLAGIAAPSSAWLTDRLAVEHQASRLLTAYRQAWLTARSRHRIALLRISADTLAIRSVVGAGAPDTTLEWSSPGPSVAAVTLASPAHTTIYGPDGVAMGLSNARHILTKGSARREVVVSRLGRVRMGN